MGSTFTTLVDSTLSHPFCTLLIVVVLWIWVNVVFKEFDEKQLSSSYANTMKKRQYWRVITAMVTHVSFIHVVININCIWNLRYLEDFYGSFYMLKYSIVLAISEMFLSFGFMAVTIRGSGNNSTIASFLHNLEACGCSGLILAWLTYQSVVSYYHNINPVFMFLGVLSLSPSFAPLIMLIVFSVVSGRNNMYANSAGLINGYLLSSGILLFLPYLYWSCAFLFDVAIVLTVSIYQYKQQYVTENLHSDNVHSLSYRVYEGSNQEELIEIQYDLTPIDDGSSRGGIDTVNSSDGTHFRSREEYDEEALEPLLEDGITNVTPSVANDNSSTFQRLSASMRRTISRARNDGTTIPSLGRGGTSGSYSRVESEEQ